MKNQIAVGLAGLACAARVARILRRTAYPLEGKVALITGGSRGLGLALAREFGGQGARVVLVARDSAELERAEQDLRGRGVQVATFQCDVVDEGRIVEVVQGVLNRFGRLDILVNNAGVMLVGPLETLSPADYQEAMNVHFWGSYYFLRASLPHLKSSRGRVVTISSIGARVAIPHMAAYCASKFALAGFSDAIRAELAQAGVRVTTVSPGLMRTGSHINASFKGNCQAEYTWFSLGAGAPLVSMDAERAARHIVAAAREGRPDLTLTIAARVLIVVSALLPNTFARITQGVNALLPQSSQKESPLRKSGRESSSAWSPSILTSLADDASPRFNEGHPP